MIELTIHGADLASPDARVLVNPALVARVRSMGRGSYAGVHFADGTSFRVQESYEVVVALMGLPLIAARLVPGAELEAALAALSSAIDPDDPTLVLGYGRLLELADAVSNAYRAGAS